jgi:hypothetical protein
VEILKALKMIMTMVNTLSRVGNLKMAMLVMMNFLQVRILKVLMDEEFPPSGDFKSSDDDYGNGGQSFPNEKFKGNNVGDDDFPPSEHFQGTDEDDEDFPPCEYFQVINEDDEEFPSSGDFQSSEDDYAIGGHFFLSEKFKGINVDDDDFPPSGDFQNTDEYFQDTKQDD